MSKYLQNGNLASAQRVETFRSLLLPTLHTLGHAWIAQSFGHPTFGSCQVEGHWFGDPRSFLARSGRLSVLPQTAGKCGIGFGLDGFQRHFAGLRFLDEQRPASHRSRPAPRLDDRIDDIRQLGCFLVLLFYFTRPGSRGSDVLIAWFIIDGVVTLG